LNLDELLLSITVVIKAVTGTAAICVS